MNTTVRSQLLQILRSRRDAIADSWYQAIARDSQVPLEAAEVRQRLVELTEQAIAFLLTEPFEHGKAQEIGAALARLRYVQPEALGRTLEILARQLVQDLPAEQAVALQPHLAALLGAVAAGFFHEAREIILAEQEQIRDALVSEIHRTKEALQESELRYRTLFESVPTGIGVATLDGEILASNDAMLQMTGYSEVELRQINLRNIYQNPEERVLLLKQLQTNGFVRDFEVTLKRKDGTPYYASLTVTPLTLGSKDLLITLAEDITARKQAEESLRESEQTAWVLLNAPVHLTLLADPDGTIVALNEAMSKSLSKSSNELVGTCIFDLFTPDVVERRRGVIEKVIRSGKPARFEDERRGRWFDSSVHPVFDAQGKAVGFAIIALDITKRKKAEEALRESEERVRALLNAPTDSALLLDLDGTIVALNEPAAERLGRAASELVGTCALDLFPPEVAELRREQGSKVLRSGKPVRFEDEREGIWFDQSAYPVFDAQGNVVQLAVFARDITERKRAEQQSIRAERLAAMGWLATALAHDINTPLQAIRSNLELALDFDLEPDEHKDCLQVVRQEVERLAEITRRVLDFAQPADDTRYPVSIARLTQKTLRLIGKQLALAHVQATTDFPADLPPVFVAPDQIVQVLLNLSINAIEAMPDGGHLHITGRVDGDTVALTLANDGPPFPAEHIERIFDPFFTTKQKGTGLGLPISHSIVHRHGGTISVENLEGDQGVAFTVTLPIIHVARLKEASA
jgi:PAS domain S-box-containing protein